MEIHSINYFKEMVKATPLKTGPELNWKKKVVYLL